MGRRVHYYRREDRRERADYSQFSSLIASPQDLGAVAVSGSSSSLTMPAKGRLAISHSAALSEGDVSVDIGALRSFSHPALLADEVHRGWYAEEGQPVVINRGAAAAAGTFTLYLVREYGNVVPIATATFT